MSLDHQTRTLYDARTRFLESGGTVGAVPGVRPDIVASWRRSLLYGLEPERSRPTYGDAAQAEQLVQATRQVVTPREHFLADSRASLALTDHTGRLLVRWVERGSFQRRLDHHDVLPGFSFAEQTIGTNSGGMVLETGAPALVAGPEHFFEESLQLTCAGAPVRHPLTRRIIGTLNLTCGFDQTTHILLAWVTELAHDIERYLTSQVTTREQALLTAYLSANHDSRQALLCLDHQTIVSNATASRMLSPSDQSLLWERAGRRITSSQPSGDESITLSDGKHALMSTTPVLDGGEPVGALIRLRAVQSPSDAPRRVGSTSSSAAAPAELPGLVGHSMRWQQMRLALAHHHGQSPVLVGELGSGRASVARAWLLGVGLDRVTLVDASAVAAAGTTSWLGQLSSAASDDVQGLVLANLEAVPEDVVPAVFGILDTAVRVGVQVVGTCSAHAASADTAALEWFDGLVQVPALADRPDDIALLLEELSHRRVGGLRRTRWESDAVQTVSRADWPTNVAGLDALVRRVVTGPEQHRVGAVDLPASVKARASRRRLIGLERVEAQAIIEALDAVDGNKKAAADALGIARSTLYRKVRALGIDLSGSTF